MNSNLDLSFTASVGSTVPLSPDYQGASTCSVLASMEFSASPPRGTPPPSPLLRPDNSTFRVFEPTQHSSSLSLHYSPSPAEDCNQASEAGAFCNPGSSMTGQQQGRSYECGFLDSPSLDLKHGGDEDDDLHCSPSPSSPEATLSVPRAAAQTPLLPLFNVASPINSSTDSGVWSSPPRIAHAGGAGNLAAPSSGAHADGGSVRKRLPNLALFATSTPTHRSISPLPIPVYLPESAGSARREVANSDRERRAVRRSARVRSCANFNGPSGR